MSRFRFSPLEEKVLQLLGERWYSREELTRELFPEHAPSATRATVSYLKRHDLVRELDRPHGQPFYEQTPLGAEILADYRRARSPLHFEGLHVV